MNNFQAIAHRTTLVQSALKHAKYEHVSVLRREWKHFDADQSVSEAMLKNHSKVTAKTHGSL